VSGKLAVFLWAAACFAQRFDLGATIGYGWYRNGTVIAPGGTATAGIGNRFAVGAAFGEDLYEHISGEVRYLYQAGDPFLSSGGKKATMQGQSHAVHYDLLFHLKPRDARVRPYGTVGGGIKYFRITGPAPQPQPFPAIASLAANNQVLWLVTAGGGVQYRLARYALLRGEFLDYISPFPNKLFIPARGGTDRGIFHQFTPMVGVSYSF
jgi:hypothetical protein